MSVSVCPKDCNRCDHQCRVRGMYSPFAQDAPQALAGDAGKETELCESCEFCCSNAAEWARKGDCPSYRRKAEALVRKEADRE